jgi:cytochrome d ubiquinol oxidase subunit I
MFKLMRFGPALPGHTPDGIPDAPGRGARRPLSTVDQMIDA